MKKVLTLLLLTQSICLYSTNNNAIQTPEYIYQKLEKAKQISSINPNSAAILYKSILESDTVISDSLVIRCCIELCQLQGKLQEFSDAFDFANQALGVAERISDSASMAEAMGHLGNLYKLFGRRETSYNYLTQSQKICKQLLHTNKTSQEQLLTAHFNLAMYYRWFGLYSEALAHLDTCYTISDQLNRSELNRIFHEAEQASIYTEIGKSKQALGTLHRIESLLMSKMDNPQVESNKKSFITMIQFYLGNAYESEKEFKLAINYYKQALETNARFNDHGSSLSVIYKRLADCEYQIKNYKEAFSNLERSKQLAEAYFGANSQRNNTLIEIKNRYQEEIDKQSIEILEQGKILADQRRRILVFQSVIIALIAIMIISSLLLRNQIQKRRFNREKDEIESKRKKSEQALDVKNKELTAFTLKLIEKEEIINSLLEKIKENPNTEKSSQSLIKNLNAGSAALWNEFNSRFVEVNTGFYEKLQELYPELSPTERKHCALIKLNFSGKEMAHLLGISVTSVHVSRYRLRKRFGLEKGENLTDFIAKI